MVSLVKPESNTRTVEIRVDLGDPAGGGGRLVHADVEDRRGNPVEVGQLEFVEVRQPELATQSLLRQGVGDRRARR